MKLTGIAIRNLKRNRKRSLLSITATAIAAYAIVFMFSFIGGMEKDMQDISYNYSSGQILVRHRDFDEKAFSLDRAIDDYREVLVVLDNLLPETEKSPRIRFPSTVLDGDKSYSSFGVGVDFAYEKDYLNLDDKIIEGRLPEKSREVLMGHGLATELNLGLGDKFTPITMTRRGASTGITFTVVGLGKYSDSAFSNKTFLVPLDELPKMLKMEGAVSEILIKGVDEDSLDATIATVNSTLEAEGFSYLEALSWKSVGLGYTWLKMADFIYTIIAFLFFAMASSVIANTMLMVVFERRKEIGTITAMGMTEREVVRLFFIEALILGILGALAGVIVGILLILPLSYIGMDLSKAMGDVEMGASFYIYPQLSIKSTIVVFFYAVFVASFISFFPSRGAAKVDPVVALRSE